MKAFTFVRARTCGEAAQLRHATVILAAQKLILLLVPEQDLQILPGNSLPPGPMVHGSARRSAKAGGRGCRLPMHLGWKHQNSLFGQK